MIRLFSFKLLVAISWFLVALTTHGVAAGELANDKLTKNQIKAAQLALNEMGFSAGVVDGALGKKTRNAYQLFA